jgi:hypothetical protein
MKSDHRLGTFEEIIAKSDENVRAIANELRRLIDELDPDSVEVPRPGDRAASYGVGPKKMSEAYAYIMPLKDYVNLGFYHGASLADPHNLLEGTGKKLRHVKVRHLATVARPEIRELIEESIRERRQAINKG